MSPPHVAGLRPVRGTAAELLALLREWDRAEDPQPLVVETSGSTGAPKQVVLSRPAMRASADATHARLGGPGRWLLNLPPTYVAGLQVLFRSVRAGTDPVVRDDVEAIGGERSYVSLVPTQLHRLLDDAARTAALTSFDRVLVGGAALDPALRRRAERAGVRVVATYGASETCGGCVYDGHPLDRVAVKVGADGRIRIGGPVLFDGYGGAAADTLEDGWFVTADLGRIDEDGHVEVLGRADDVLVSGGVNVPAAAVAARLRAHPAVQAAEVVGVPDAEWGQQVVAVVVGDLTLAEARDWVAGRHPRTWAPRRVVRLDAMPMLAHGKVDRLAVRRLAEDPVEPVEPVDPVDPGEPT